MAGIGSTYKGAPRHPVYGQSFRGVRKEYQAAIVENIILPYWAQVDPQKVSAHCRRTLTNWGLATFRVFEGAVWGRLTSEGIRARDYYHAEAAEKIEEKRKKLFKKYNLTAKKKRVLKKILEQEKTE